MPFRKILESNQNLTLLLQLPNKEENIFVHLLIGCNLFIMD